MKKVASLDAMTLLLKAMAQSSRLRVLVLLYHEDLTVSELTFILGKSRFLVSWHLRLLYKARLVERYQKEEEVYFKLCHGCWDKEIVMAAILSLPESDVMLGRDLARLVDLKEQHRKKIEEYFLQNAAQWDALRLSYVADHVVENALLEIVGNKPFETMLDIGTGTGSVLKLFSGLYTYAVEIAIESDALHLSVGNTTFDLVILHWVSYFLDSPQRVFNEVARILRPNGRFLIVDFCFHKTKSSYAHHAYMRLGFSNLQIKQWLKSVGLILEKTVCLTPMQNENKKGLMVKLWLARDPRLLIDDIKDKHVEFA
ncbi:MULTISPECIES: ArsR/SmtB family transcription factor [unclassified Bartonella]|uniref:ArsR/SmtB family transcription factor n=1 Tax=unclassified Bartonella TaxID=2645622 RepID=UPI00300E5A64